MEKRKMERRRKNEELHAPPDREGDVPYGFMVNDDPELAKEEFQILANIRKMASMPNEEEEILQTRIVSPKEVSDHWQDWIPAVKSEVDSLLYDKQAFKEIGPEELSQRRQEAEKAGRGIEFIPSKLVFTRKPGPDGGRKKMRWVACACGNLEPKKEDEDNFSSGADAASLRILVWCATLFQWSASILDVRTAFLNAKTVLSEDDSCGSEGRWRGPLAHHPCQTGHYVHCGPNGVVSDESP